MKKYFTKIIAKTILVIIAILAPSAKLFAAVSPPASCTASIGSPANGASHYINITWSSVSGATAYQLQYSVDSITWLPLDSGTVTSYNHNTGSIGNLPYYYHVRTIESGNTSVWTDATPFPIYSACNDPLLPQLSNATGHSMNLVIEPELPDSNPYYTTYSIFCTTTSQYVQTDGTLGATEIFQTRSAWGTVDVNGLTPSTQYCFYAKARNNDGDVRVAAGTPISSTESFTTNADFNTSGSAPTNKYWSPASCTTGGLNYFSTGGCPGGYVGFTGSFNNYFGCFLRSPQQNCTGDTSVVLNFDISNSYIPSHIQSSPSSSDAIDFYTWVDNGYKYNATSIKINGVEKSETDINGTWLLFDTLRTCVNVDVTFDLTTSVNLSNILFYLSPQCAYNDSYTYSVGLDNITFQQSVPATSCLTTLTSVGVYESILESGFSIYPNPARDNLIIKSTAEIKNAHIAIINTLGQEIYSEDIKNIPDAFNAQIPLLFSSGIYFVQVADETGKWTGKFVKE